MMFGMIFNLLEKHSQLYHLFLWCKDISGCCLNEKFIVLLKKVQISLRRGATLKGIQGVKGALRCVLTSVYYPWVALPGYACPEVNVVIMLLFSKSTDYDSFF